MASGDRLRIADKPTLDNVNKNLGETADTGGSETAGTAMAKLNEDLRVGEATYQEIQNLGVTINGEASPYGTGSLGDVTFNSSKFTWPSQDYYNRYIVQVKSLTIPSGQTMKPPAKCDGLYILSQGDVTIDGNIDVRGLRKTFGDIKMSPTINIGTKTFELAKGGYSPKGGASGAGGTANSSENGDFSAPSAVPQNSIIGNINGGGSGKYGINSTPSSMSSHRKGDEDRTPYTQITQYGSSTVIISENAAGALIIMAKGKVTINGNILASGTSGVNAQNGTDPSGFSGSSTAQRITGYTGLGGAGAIPPSGGGAVTIICNSIQITGKIDTNGSKFTSPDGSDSSASIRAYYGAGYVYGGKGGKGGTFISTAGEIKVYEGVDE